MTPHHSTASPPAKPVRFSSKHADLPLSPSPLPPFLILMASVASNASCASHVALLAPALLLRSSEYSQKTQQTVSLPCSKPSCAFPSQSVKSTLLALELWGSDLASFLQLSRRHLLPSPLLLSRWPTLPCCFLRLSELDPASEPLYPPFLCLEGPPLSLFLISSLLFSVFCSGTTPSRMLLSPSHSSP